MPPAPSSKASTSKAPPSKLPTSDKRSRPSTATGKAQPPKENADAPHSAFAFAKSLVKDKDRASQKYALPDLLKQERSKMGSQGAANAEPAKKQGADRARKPALVDLHCKLSFKDWVARTPLDEEGGKGGRA